MGKVTQEDLGKEHSGQGEQPVKRLWCIIRTETANEAGV